MVPDKLQKVENLHFTWCGYIGFRARYYVNLNEIFRKCGHDTNLNLQSTAVFTNMNQLPQMAHFKCQET